MELFIPIVPCRTSQPCSIEKYFDKMAASYNGSDTAKQQFFMRLQLRLQSLHKHDFISDQLLFYCWLTQHFNFSVSFSFKLHTMCGVFEEVCKRIDTFKW